jgi:L-fuconolactonase
LGPIYRDFGPDDLAPLLARHAIAQTILVQAAPTIAETSYMLRVAAETSFVAGVVGWFDFTAPDAADTIDGLAHADLLVGLRPMVQDIADDDWLLRPDLAAALLAMIDHALVFDALVLPRHLSRLVRLVERFPSLRVVIDHGAKPDIKSGAVEPWRSYMSLLAGNPNVHCKLSGLVTEARADQSDADIDLYAQTLLDLFGPDRLIWGSDWPVVNLAGGYDRWRALTLDVLAPLSEIDRAKVLGGNAADLYLEKRGQQHRERSA